MREWTDSDDPWCQIMWGECKQRVLPNSPHTCNCPDGRREHDHVCLFCDEVLADWSKHGQV